MASADGQGDARRLNQTPNHEERPRFSPDGKKLIWTSQATDPTQISMCDFDAAVGRLNGQPHQVTDLSTGADGAIWTGDGKNLVFLSRVYPDCKDDACNQKRDEEQKAARSKRRSSSVSFIDIGPNLPTPSAAISLWSARRMRAANVRMEPRAI
ncbi:hypothetical protein BH20VER3_BH20VER3_07510 [soil metagenome]